MLTRGMYLCLYHCVVIVSLAINAVLQRGDIWSSVGQPQCGHIGRCMYKNATFNHVAKNCIQSVHA